MLILKSTYKCEKCGKKWKGFTPFPAVGGVQIIIENIVRVLCKGCSKKFKKHFEEWLRCG